MSIVTSAARWRILNIKQSGKSILNHEDGVKHSTRRAEFNIYYQLNHLKYYLLQFILQSQTQHNLHATQSYK